MTNDSPEHLCNSGADSLNPHRFENPCDALLWAAGLSKAASDRITERTGDLNKRMQGFNAKLEEDSLGPDERANIESALALLRNVHEALQQQNATLHKLAHIQSDHAKDLSDRPGKDNISNLYSKPVMPGEANDQIVAKSLMLVADIRSGLRAQARKIPALRLKTMKCPHKNLK